MVDISGLKKALDPKPLIHVFGADFPLGILYGSANIEDRLFDFNAANLDFTWEWASLFIHG